MTENRTNVLILKIITIYRRIFVYASAAALIFELKSLQLCCEIVHKEDLYFAGEKYFEEIPTPPRLR